MMHWMHLAGVMHSPAVQVLPCPWPPPERRREECVPNAVFPNADELPPLLHFNAIQTKLPFPVSPPLLSCLQFQHLRHQMVCWKKSRSLAYCCLYTPLWIVVEPMLAIAVITWNQNLSGLCNASVLLLCPTKPKKKKKNCSYVCLSIINVVLQQFSRTKISCALVIYSHEIFINNC